MRRGCPPILGREQKEHEILLGKTLLFLIPHAIDMLSVSWTSQQLFDAQLVST